MMSFARTRDVDRLKKNFLCEGGDGLRRDPKRRFYQLRGGANGRRDRREGCECGRLTCSSVLCVPLDSAYG